MKTTTAAAATEREDEMLNTRIYYTGDMMNEDGFGVIDKQRDPQVHVTLDDGRDMWVPATMIGTVYAGHCAPRFVTVDAYNSFRSARWESYGWPMDRFQAAS